MKILTLSILFLLSCSPEESKNKSTEPLYDYDIEERIKSLGYDLKEPDAPLANFATFVRTGNLVYMSGNGPRRPDGTFVTGKLGDNMTIEEAQEAARLTAIRILGGLKKATGDLNKVKRFVKVLGMVNATPDFKDHPKVVNGFSDLIVEIFGERGKHARSAVGMGSLPFQIPIEIEVIVEVID